MKRNFLKGILVAFLILSGSNSLVKPAKAERVTRFAQGVNHYIPLYVANRGYYTIDLSSHFGADADLYIYDENNALVARSILGGSDVLEGYLNPGSYSIRIYMSMCLSDYCTANITVRRDGRGVRLFR